MTQGDLPPQPPAPPPTPPGGAPWRRLDSRMLLVHPVRETGRFLIPLVVVLVAGRSTENPASYLVVLVPIVIGVVRYLTTSFRVANGRVELKRGLLERHVLSVPVDRVRTVDLTASPVHRLLGLTTLKVGTATASTDADERVDLDGLSVAEAHELRAALLRVAEPAAEPGAPTAPVHTAAEFQPSWLRFAPFTSSGVVLAAALLGGGSQFLSQIGWFDSIRVDTHEVSAPVWVVLLAAVAALLAFAAASTALSVVGYLLANWGFRLTHHHDAWHVTRGLLTTREISLDDARVAGVRVSEPLGLRLVGGARLSAIATGLRGGDGGGGSSALLPPAPRPVVDDAATAVCEGPAPVAVPLRDHGPAAVRRRWVRALTPAALLLALVVAAWLGADAPGWLLVPALLVVAAAGGLAADRSRALGHALAERFLVARSGSLLRARDVLRTDHVIGWTLRATFWQRRVGLTTLVATTAGGRQRVVVLDVPEAAAVELADSAVPGLVEQFSEHGEEVEEARRKPERSDGMREPSRNPERNRQSPPGR